MDEKLLKSKLEIFERDCTTSSIKKFRIYSNKSSGFLVRFITTRNDIFEFYLEDGIDLLPQGKFNCVVTDKLIVAIYKKYLVWRQK